MNIIMTDMLAEAMKGGAIGLDREIQAVENELADQPRTGQTLRILQECMANMQLHADMLRGTVARYEKWKKEK